MYITSSTLTAAQKAAHRRPYVELKAYEKIADVNRLRFTRHYTGIEADARHAACMPADGSLLRVRAVQNGGQYDLGYSRVTSPGAGSTYSSWSTLVSNISETSGFAFATSTARVALFYVGANKADIKYARSSNSGSTYGTSDPVVTAVANVLYLAAAYKNADILVLFYATATAVYRIVCNDGLWGAPAAWTNTANSITGLAVHYVGDYNLAITGTDTSDHAKVWTCLYGDGYSQTADTWSALMELMHASNGSNVTYSHTAVGRPDVFRILFLEEYAGTGAYTYPMATHSVPLADFVDNRWREPWPLNKSSDYGLAFCYSSTKAWITTPAGVWSATITNATLDLTEDLLKLEAKIGPTTARLTATLRNDDGTYLESGSGKGQAWLGCQLNLGLGYFTSAGNEVPGYFSFWIDSYELVTDAAVATLVLHATGAWELLERWRARRQYAWASGAKTVYQLIGFLLARAGLDHATTSASAAITTLQPAFTINPGESAAAAIKRLLSMVPDVLRFRKAIAYNLHPQASDASAYSYGLGHAIYSGRYRSGALAPNRVQVYGSGALGEDMDWTSVELLMDNLKQIREANLTTEADADAQASAAIRKAAMASSDDRVTIPPTGGLEVYDVVDVTDAHAGLSATKRRALAVATSYDAQKPTYHQTLILGEA